MLFKFRILFHTLITTLLLLFVLSMGAQNLNNRHKLQIGFGTTAPLPTGFLIGVSIILGVISGGSTAALITPAENRFKDRN